MEKQQRAQTVPVHNSLMKKATITLQERAARVVSFKLELPATPRTGGNL